MNINDKNLEDTKYQQNPIQKVTFAIASDFIGLGGLELMLLQYYKLADKNRFNIKIVCLDKGKREETLKFLERRGVGNENVIMIKDSDAKFGFLLGNWFTKKFFYALIRPLASFFIYVFGLRKILGKELDSQVVYLFNNELNSYFRKFKGLVIGHNGMWVIDERSISFHLIKNRLLWKRIDGMRLFPQYSKYVNNLNRKHNFVLQNGIDVNLYHPPREDKNWKEIRFLFVGRLDYGKGFDLLIAAVSLIPKDFNFKLFIVGEGVLRTIIPADDNRVEYLGKKNSEEVADIYRNSDILVLPSRWDPYPLVVLEALSSGLGVIVTQKLKGAYDDFERVNALRYTPLEPGEISQNMQEMATEIEEIRNNFPVVHNLIVEKHDVAKITNLLLSELTKKYIAFNKGEG
ncbi:glycosyltransferase family 4 protein [Thermoplasmatales archaeon AK]|nr:glycosyltransferase family 4 protein [Thermoplasmatales archaeon AK]